MGKSVEVAEKKVEEMTTAAKKEEELGKKREKMERKARVDKLRERWKIKKTEKEEGDVEKITDDAIEVLEIGGEQETTVHMDKRLRSGRKKYLLKDDKQRSVGKGVQVELGEPGQVKKKERPEVKKGERRVTKKEKLEEDRKTGQTLSTWLDKKGGKPQDCEKDLKRELGMGVREKMKVFEKERSKEKTKKIENGRIMKLKEMFQRKEEEGKGFKKVERKEKSKKELQWEEVVRESRSGKERPSPAEKLIMKNESDSLEAEQLNLDLKENRKGDIIGTSFTNINGNLNHSRLGCDKMKLNLSMVNNRPIRGQSVDEREMDRFDMPSGGWRR